MFNKPFKEQSCGYSIKASHVEMLHLLATTRVKFGSSHLKVRNVFLPKPELSGLFPGAP